MTESKAKETPVADKDRAVKLDRDDMTAQQKLEADNARTSGLVEEETQAFRGEGGAVHILALPLSDVYADQVRKGVLTPVDDDATVVPFDRETERELTGHRADGGDLQFRSRYGGPWDATLPGGVTPVDRPAPSASKDAWTEYAIATTGRPAVEFSGKTKAELIEQVG